MFIRRTELFLRPAHPTVSTQQERDSRATLKPVNFLTHSIPRPTISIQSSRRTTAIADCATIAAHCQATELRPKALVTTTGHPCFAALVLDTVGSREQRPASVGR